MKKLPTALIVSAALLAACSSFKTPLSPYKMDIRQGNYITPEMREQLKLGMSKQQTQSLLGTPMINDAFHGNRWDYVYSFEKQGKVVDKQRLALYFEDDKLVRIEDNGRVADDSNIAKADQSVEEISLSAVPLEEGGRPTVASSSSVVPEVSLDAIPLEEEKQEKPAVVAPEPERTAVAPAPSIETRELPRETPPPAPTRPAVAVADSGGDRSEVSQSIRSWANAWAARDVAQYLASYGSNFKPSGMSRSAWEAQRKSRIGKAKSIDVDVRDLSVAMADVRHARVTFKQDYRSDSYRDSTYKGLILEKVGERWLIVSEQELKGKPKPMRDAEMVAMAESAPATASAQASAPEAPASASSGSRPALDISDEIVQRVENWQAAWSARDVDGYLASYADKFKPEGMSHDAWVALRKERIARTKSINVDVSDVNVRLLSDTRADVSFKQDYRSDVYKDRSHKKLLLEKIGREWLIVAELERKR